MLFLAKEFFIQFFKCFYFDFIWSKDMRDEAFFQDWLRNIESRINSDK